MLELRLGIKVSLLERSLFQGCPLKKRFHSSQYGGVCVCVCVV